SPDTADRAAAEARTVLDLAGAGQVRVIAGSNVGLKDRVTPIDSPGARAIIEAAHADDPRPLYVCLGAGLTELASAWLLEPSIAGRLTAIWIGGAEYPGLAVPPPGATPAEYNTMIDPIAAQVVLNDSDLPLWQVPRDAYRQALASMAELEVNLAGELGAYLVERLTRIAEFAAGHGFDPGEMYVLGDSPLVLLSTLHTAFEPTPASSFWVDRVAPRLADDGSYDGEGDPDRMVRVYTRIDTSLIMRDLYAKVARHARSRS
ncbi:MAG: nucleoside hydrolase, partial [Propionicimonas sp.]